MKVNTLGFYHTTSTAAASTALPRCRRPRIRTRTAAADNQYISSDCL